MEDQAVEIILSRGTTGLGFNIRGGIDIQHIPGDSGIFVAKLKDDGAACRDGRLKIGDKILSINGQSLTGLTHQEAVDVFIKAGETVTLQVVHNAERLIKGSAVQKQYREKPDGGDAEKSSGGSGFRIALLLGALTVAAVAAGIFIHMKKR